MADGKYVTYYRVSTQRQGASGLGIEAQRVTVDRYLNGGSWSVVASFTEVESGADNERPEMLKALATCRVHGATLLIAKLDRLSRDAHFLLGLAKQGVTIRIAEMPEIDETMFGLMAIFAQHERKLISARTKAALAPKVAAGAFKGNGARLANVDRRPNAAKARVALVEKADARAKDLAEVIRDVQAHGATTLQAIADALNARGISTARGGQWQPTQVARVMARVG